MIKRIVQMVLFVSCLFCMQTFVTALEDPTRPPDYISPQGEQQVASLTLNEIIISKNRKFAIINGQTVLIGDKIMGNQLLLIEKNQVQLQTPSGIVTLYLFAPAVKH